MTEIGPNNEGFAVPLPGRPEGALRLAWASATDVGHRRQVNEDSYVARFPVFAVADGMGGHSAGDLASAAVVNRLAEVAETEDAGLLEPRSIEEALHLATEDIATIAGDSELGVGTTVTGAVLTVQDDHLYFAVFNIGDSRVYRFEANDLAQVTTDHSVVQELVESGALTREEAESHPDSNIITRAVGFSARPYPDFWMVPVRGGLRLLICSDGLTKEVSDERLRMHMGAGLSPYETAGALIDAALASGGRDNVTAVVVDVLEAPDEVDIDDTAPRAHRL
ncbi:protein phosphatase 2C domain-containing protein [Salinibacterium sp. G-O1]|uniref:PP2C family protein-serine/threonine phosphatase n=1 Tax=Salinibacterium sp. G-O1 TaxID=3046208 RepID=UPI0024B8AAE4|nr:protein phosphatase 2C domain-containing protein [Salinibacterium sp. G-O1]MDJ0334698.1 protein phosphatase 2C domain-containing protein [Salinibacterium sp. G-O1]